MAVWTVKATMPNGVAVSGPVVSDTAEAAVDYFTATHDIEKADKAVIDVTLREDPNGEFERMLVEAEIRRRESEYYHMPAKRRGRR